MADQIRRTPGIWGGELVQQPSMGGSEVADPSDGPTEFCLELPRPENEPEEVAVYFGELFTNTEAPAVSRGSMGGRLWSAIAERLP